MAEKHLTFFDPDTETLHDVVVPVDDPRRAYEIEHYVFWEHPSWLRLPVLTR